jgi:hypothetical protein
MEQAEKMSAFATATARQSLLFSTTRAKTGGKGIRTPDFQLAKLALYQLSYAPTGTPNAFACSRLMSELPNFDCRFSIARKKRKMPDVDLTIGIRPVLHFFEPAKLRSCAENAACFSFVSVHQQAPPNMAFSHLQRSLYP